jgi:predicted transcriptional regulator
MAGRRSRTLTEVELEFMQIVWHAGEVTTEDVLAALRRQGRDLSDGSVRKMLSILMIKGYLSRQPDGRGFIYRSTVPRERANRKMVQDLVRRAFGGSAAMMVAALMHGRRVSEQELTEIKRLIAKREKEGRG